MQGTHTYEVEPVLDPSTPTVTLTAYLERIDKALCDIARGRKPLVNDIRRELRTVRAEIVWALVLRPWAKRLSDIQTADASARC